MNQKGPIKRKRNYRVQSYLNENSSIVIEAYLQGCVYRHLDKQVENLLQESIFKGGEQYSEQQMSLYEYRKQRKKVDLLNGYLISSVAFVMITVEFTLMLFLRIYLTWTNANGFERGFVVFVMPFISMHMLYCVYIYITERFKEVKGDVEVE